MINFEETLAHSFLIIVLVFVSFGLLLGLPPENSGVLKVNETSIETKKEEILPQAAYATPPSLAATVSGDGRITVLEATEDVLRLKNVSSGDIRFKTYPSYLGLEILIPKDAKFTIFRTYAENTGEWNDWMLGMVLDNGLFIDFRHGVDGPWGECSYQQDKCYIEDFTINNINFSSRISKKSGKLLDTWAIENPYSIEDIRITTKDGRQLNDADKAVIEKVLMGTKSLKTSKE